MRKLIMGFMGFLIAVSLSAQTINWYRYIFIANEGVKIGNTVEKSSTNKSNSLLIKIDSVIGDNATTPTLFKVYNGATKLNPDISDTLNVSGILVQIKDSSSTAKTNSYATGKMLADGLAGISTDNSHIIAIQSMGSVIKAMAIGVTTHMVTTSNSMTNGRINLIPVYLAKATTLTGVKLYMATQGDYTADNNNRLGLYSFSAGTLTLVASCANNGNLWKAAANTFITTAFSSTYSAAVGLYYVGVLYNQSAQTTAPKLAGPTMLLNSAFATLDFTNSNTIGGYVAGTNLTSPITMSGLNQSATMFWVAVY